MANVNLRLADTQCWLEYISRISLKCGTIHQLYLWKVNFLNWILQRENFSNAEGNLDLSENASEVLTAAKISVKDSKCQKKSPADCT